MKNEAYKLLKWSHFSDGFSNDEIADLSDYFESMTYLPADRIFSQGTVGIGMGIVIEGSLKVVLRNKNGSEKRIAGVCPNETVGEMSVLEDLPRMADVIAEEKSTLLLITRPNFETLLGDDPPIAAKFLLAISRILARRIRSAHGQLNKIV